MPEVSYDDAVNQALERTVETGFFFGGSTLRGFAQHAPMGAEALAMLGHTDQVPGWVDWYAKRRRPSDLPERVTVIDPGDARDWRNALGDVRRLADWVEMFRRQIVDLGWSEAVTTWWPRLTRGMMAGLTHGLIRTAHALRSVATVREPSILQLNELANGLGFWAAMYQPPRAMFGGGAPGAPDRPGAAQLLAAAEKRFGESPDAGLTELSAACAGRYAVLPRGGNPVPAIHAVTAPAALRMVLPLLPREMARPSFEAVSGVCGTLLSAFGPEGPEDGNGWEDGDDPVWQRRVIEEAIELRDEHSIKIAEAVLREYDYNPDPRYFRAVQHAVRLIRKSRF